MRSVVFSASGTVPSTYAISIATDFAPTIGDSYPATFSSTSATEGDQGDVTLKCIKDGTLLILSPLANPTRSNYEDSWFVEFDSGSVTLYAMLSGGATVSLEVYDS